MEDDEDSKAVSLRTAASRAQSRARAALLARGSAADGGVGISAMFRSMAWPLPPAGPHDYDALFAAVEAMGGEVGNVTWRPDRWGGIGLFVKQNPVCMCPLVFGLLHENICLCLYLCVLLYLFVSNCVY